jgi:hypothetical protein
MASFTARATSGEIVQFTLEKGFEDMLRRVEELGGLGKTFQKEFGKANRRIGTAAAKFVRRTVRGVAGERISRDIRSRVAKRGPRGERLQIPGFQVGVFPKRPSSPFALVQERGTKMFNPEAPRDIEPRGRGVRALAVKTADKEGGRHHPLLEDGLVAVYWGRTVRTATGYAIGGLYRAEDVKQAKRSGQGGLRSVRAVYLLMTFTGIKPKFYLRRAMEIHSDEIEKGYSDFFAGWFESGNSGTLLEGGA